MLSESETLQGGAEWDSSLDEVIRSAQRGEESAFEEILDRFEAKALLTARSMGASRQDAEDIAQDAFLKIFRYIRSYRSGRSFRAYFHRIVINACRDHMARMGTKERSLEEEEIEGREAHPGLDADAVDRVRAALRLLPMREREVAILRDMHGLSTWQVSMILRISPITVRRHSSRALARLREILGRG